MDLVSVASPEVIVPYNLVSLWSPSDGLARNDVRASGLPQWDDVRRGVPGSNSLLARMPIRLAAMFACERSSPKIRIYAISYAGEGEPIRLFSFEWDSEKEPVTY
jgi:hypothetical protein